jgi:hypothetical protein
MTQSQVVAGSREHGNVPGLAVSHGGRRRGPMGGFRHWWPFYVMMAPGLIIT